MTKRTRGMIHLPYGKDRGIDLEIDDSRIQGIFRAPAASRNVAALIEEALDHPIDFPPLEQSVIPDDRITLVLEADLPYAPEFLAAIWKRLAGRGLSPEQVTILQPIGPPDAPAADPRTALPRNIGEQMRWIRHEPPPEDSGDLHYLATTASGERIYLAEELVAADVVIAVGSLGFDPLLGFRGTHSAFFPSCSSLEAFRRTQGQGHSELSPENDRPLRQIIDEVGWLLGAAFTIQALPAASGGIAAVLAGASETVMRRGREFLNDHWRLAIDERAETVVVALDGVDGRNGWGGLASAMALARRMVVREGRIIVLSDLAGEPGEGLKLLANLDQPDEAVRKLRDALPPDLMSATQFATAVDWARVYLLARLDDDLVEDLFCIPIEQEREIARLLAGTDGSCLLIESAQFADGRVE